MVGFAIIHTFRHPGSHLSYFGKSLRNINSNVETSRGSGYGRESMMHLYLFIRFSIFHVTRMSETVTFGREFVAYARCLAEY